MQRFIFTDLVSPFHMAAAIVAARRLSDGPAEIELRQVPNVNGEFLLGESSRTFGPLWVHVRCCRQPNNSYFTWALKFVCFILLKWGGRRSRSAVDSIWLGHHTYFKPTALAAVRVRDLPKVRIVAFEEGVGTYGDMAHHVWASRLVHLSFPRTKYVLRRVLAKRIFVDAVSSVMTGSADDGDLARVMRWMVENLYEGGLAGSIDLSEGDLRQKRVLIAGSPFHALGELSRDEYRAVLRKVLRNIEGKIWVKPHPLERDLTIYREIGVECLSANLPGEAVVAALAPVTVVGFGTGLLRTAARIPGASCIDALGEMPPRFQDNLPNSELRTHSSRNWRRVRGFRT
jgi:hypothetical protein